MRPLAVAWAAVFFIAGAMTIKFYPPVNYNLGDEIWALNNSIDAAGKGLPSGLITPRLYFLLMGHFLSLTGGGVFSARLFTLLAASAALYLTYALGRQVRGEAAGLLSSVLLGTTFAFNWHARVVRHEMLTTVFALAAFMLFYAARERGAGRYLFYSLFVAALSIHVHPNNLQYVLGLLVLYPLVFGRRALGAASLWLLGGLAAGFALWLYVAYLPAAGPAAQAEVTARGIASVLPSPLAGRGFFGLFVDTLRSVPKDFMQYITLFNVFFPSSVDIAFVVVPGAALSLAALITKARRKAAILLLFVFIVNFVNYFITEHFGYWHVVELYPFVAVAMVLGLLGLGDMLKGRMKKGFIAAGALYFVVLGAADTAATAYGMRGYGYEKLLEEVSGKVDGRVLGMDLYAPAFGRGQFVPPWFNIEKPSGDCPAFKDKVNELGVRYVIADNLLQRFSRMACGAGYEREMVEFLFTECRLVAVVSGRYPNYWAEGGMVSEIYVFRTPGP